MLFPSPTVTRYVFSGPCHSRRKENLTNPKKLLLTSISCDIKLTLMMENGGRYVPSAQQVNATVHPLFDAGPSVFGYLVPLCTRMYFFFLSVDHETKVSSMLKMYSGRTFCTPAFSKLAKYLKRQQTFFIPSTKETNPRMYLRFNGFLSHPPFSVTLIRRFPSPDEWVPFQKISAPVPARSARF